MPYDTIERAMKRFFLLIFTTLSLFAPHILYAQCASSNNQGGCSQVDTAIGPITATPGGIAGSIMTILMSLSGGVAILLVIAAGYQLITSQGNPEKVKEGRERLISAIVGLLFIIFSVAILQIIGIDILHIPGLSRQ